MRIFRGLENIHAVIDRHEAEWRREQGEEPERPDAISLEEAVRRRLTAQPDAGSGRFSADRFLGGSTKPAKNLPETEPETTPEPEIVSSPEPEHEAPSAPESTRHHSWLYNEVMKAVNQAKGGNKDAKIVAVFVPVLQEGREIPQTDDEAVPEDDGEKVRAVEIIRNKDGRHSRLYDEVMRAVNDVADGGKAGKIVAVFVPLVQNGKEFEDLPADETVTLSPVSEDAVKIETLPENEPEQEPEIEPATEEIPPEAEEVPEVAEVPEIPEEPETETFSAPEDNYSEPGDFDLIPEGQEEPDAELAGAFREMEEKLDETLQEERENELEEESELAGEPEAEDISELPDELPESEPELGDITETAQAVIEEEPLPDIIIETGNDPDTVPEVLEEVSEIPEELPPELEDEEIISDGEPMEFEELGEETPEEITLPDDLDDDEVFSEAEFDESLTEVQRPDDEDEDTIVLEEAEDKDGDKEEEEEIEILPDTVN